MELIKKILFLTIFCTMFIVSTCFAAEIESDELLFIINTVEELVSSKNPEHIGKPILVARTDSSTYKVTIINSSECISYDSMAHSFKVDSSGYFVLRVSSSEDGYILTGGDDVNFNTSTTGVNVYSNTIVYLEVDLYRNGKLLASSSDYASKPEEPEEPVIPDIPMIDLPSTGYSKNYAIKYVHEDGSIRLVLFSSDSPIEFSSTVKDKKATIAFTYTTSAKYSTYILRNELWDPLINSTYSTPGTFTQSFTFENILSSDINLYNEDGTIFFPQTPLLEMIAGVGLMTMWETILKAMILIVIIAVSLLALWISLVVLLKVLRTYLT